MKKKYSKAYITICGEVIIERKKTLWDKIKNVFKLIPTVRAEIYAPKKPYTEKEMIKLMDMLALLEHNDCDDKDYAAVINSIRSNTFKESILEAKDNKYYVCLETDAYIYDFSR